MSGTNSKIATIAGMMTNPLTFAAVVDSTMTDVNANLDVILTALAKEETDASDHRLFLDEMSPQARASMYCIISALKAKLTTS